MNQQLLSAGQDLLALAQYSRRIQGILAQPAGLTFNLPTGYSGSLYRFAPSTPPTSAMPPPGSNARPGRPSPLQTTMRFPPSLGQTARFSPLSTLSGQALAASLPAFSVAPKNSRPKPPPQSSPPSSPTPRRRPTASAPSSPTPRPPPPVPPPNSLPPTPVALRTLPPLRSPATPAKGGRASSGRKSPPPTSPPTRSSGPPLTPPNAPSSSAA